MTIPTDRLVQEALAKSGLLWVQSGEGGGPLWHVAVDGVAYAVIGEGEQASPQHVGRSSVIARSKETRARLISCEADIDTVSPSDDDWAPATAALKAGRLNAPSGDVVARWAEHATVLRIRPELHTVILRGRLLPPPPAEPETPSASADDPTATKTSAGTSSASESASATPAAARAAATGQTPTPPAPSANAKDTSDTARVSE